jgi:hypothetical protein
MASTWDEWDPLFKLPRRGAAPAMLEWFQWGMEEPPIPDDDREDPIREREMFEHTYNAPTIAQAFDQTLEEIYIAQNYLKPMLYEAGILKLDLGKKSSRFKIPWLKDSKVPYFFRTEALPGWFGEVKRQMGKDWTPTKPAGVLKPRRARGSPQKPKKTGPWPMDLCIMRITTTNVMAE